MRRSRRMPARAPLVLVIAVAIFLAVWLVRSATEDAARLKIDDVRLVSYYPATHGWELMWTRWDPAGMAADFERVADLEANTVRVIVQPDAFGYPEPRPAMLDRLDRAIELADESGLYVQLTLFDHWSAYGDERGSELWASRVLARYRGDARIAFIELKNEIAAGDPKAMAWARALLPVVQGLAPSTPVTLSPAGRGNAATLRKLKQGLRGVDPDFWDIHVFARPDATYATLAAAKAVAAPLPLLIGETGYATIPDNPRDPRIADSRAMQEAWQGHYLRTIAHAAQSLDLPVTGTVDALRLRSGSHPRRDADLSRRFSVPLRAAENRWVGQTRLRRDRGGLRRAAHRRVGEQRLRARGARRRALDAARMAARRPGRRLLPPLDGDRTQRQGICLHPGQRR